MWMLLAGLLLVSLVQEIMICHQPTQILTLWQHQSLGGIGYAVGGIQPCEVGFAAPQPACR